MSKKFYTDYPFTELGDIEYQEAPVREAEVLAYDGDKYCDVRVCGREFSIKAGYIYTTPGRYGEVEVISRSDLSAIESQATDA